MGFEFMYGAYSVAWVVIFSYMLILGKRHTKLKKEIEIMDFINNLDVVSNYKTIKKSVKMLNDLVENAKNNNIAIDPDVIAKVNSTTARLISERNLR